MPKNHQIAKRIFPAEQDLLGKHARDVQTILDGIPVEEQREVEALYAEPMTMGALKEEPFSIKLERIVNLFAPETPVTACTGFVHWIWKPQVGGAQIQSITGMSVATHGQTKFRFSFRISYRLQKGAVVTT